MRLVTYFMIGALIFLLSLAAENDNGLPSLQASKLFTVSSNCRPYYNDIDPIFNDIVKGLDVGIEALNTLIKSGKLKGLSRIFRKPKPNIAKPDYDYLRNAAKIVWGVNWKKSGYSEDDREILETARCLYIISLSVSLSIYSFG